VIFTTQLPSKSVEPGKDIEVAKLIESIFPYREAGDGIIISNQKSVKACFISHPDGQKLRDVLRNSCDNFDVDYPLSESLQYIHKVFRGRNIYYFANTGGSSVSDTITLRGNMNLEVWDPHSGNIRKAMAETVADSVADLSCTRVKLDLMPYRSCFLVEIPEKK
jgi:hypothetical protein